MFKKLKFTLKTLFSFFWFLINIDYWLSADWKINDLIEKVREKSGNNGDFAGLDKFENICYNNFTIYSWVGTKVVNWGRL